MRDAAARLPGGEGSRADVCELLKESQYVIDGVNDVQISQVASGALPHISPMSPLYLAYISRISRLYLPISRRWRAARSTACTRSPTPACATTPSARLGARVRARDGLSLNPTLSRRQSLPLTPTPNPHP